MADLELYHIDPTKPFVLRTDASDYAVGAVLEQFPLVKGMPELADIKPGASIPVAFMSRKLTTGQRQKWDTRDKETYAIVSALDKWAPYILDNQVLILTDHKILQSWYEEYVAGVGPQGRRARWHAKLNNFRLEVVHVPGAKNEVGDALSRWAYPASQGYKDVSWHGTAADASEMQQQIAREREEERECPKAIHPTHIDQGPSCTIIPSENGKELALVQLFFSSSSPSANISVTTRSQSKKVQVQDPTPHSTVTHTQQDQTDTPAPPITIPSPPIISSSPVPSAAAASGDPPRETDREGEGNIFAIDWGSHYENCPKFGPVWQEIQVGDSWPQGFRVQDGKLLKDGVWCVPESLIGRVLQAQHSVSGHIGGERLLREASRHYQFSDPEKARIFAGQMQRTCGFCQAGEHPHQPLHLKVVPTPIPPHIMASVSIDLFVMPEVEFEGKIFNVLQHVWIGIVAGWWQPSVVPKG